MAASFATPTPELIDQVTTGITKAISLHPSATWVRALLPTLRAAPPPVLTKTASFRLLTTDFTTSLSQPKTTIFPSTIHDASLPERTLPAGRPIPVQVIGVEDLGRSRMEQIEALEAVERGETRKGREIIRVVREEREEGGQGKEEERTAGPCRLVLQDAAGVRVYGIELKPVEGVKLGMFVGTKIILHKTIVARAVLLLEPGTTTVLGGKIESLHAMWFENRKKELMAAIGAAN
ncbi:MAG: hypothetical protein M1839_000139 [Geoglossum umbratile]|nr:MAG: hypothetical protein M1839_000139 [Geoglossum umbratile]